MVARLWRGSVLLLSLLTTLVLFSVAHAPVAARQHDPSSADITLHAEPAYGGIARTNRWLPLNITVENNGPNIDAIIRVHVPRSTTFVTPIDLPSFSKKAVTIAVFPPGPFRHLIVDIVSQAPSANPPILAEQRIPLRNAPAAAYVVGIVSGDNAQIVLPDTFVDERPLITVPLTPNDIPTHSAHLSFFDALLLNDIPAQQWSDPQQTALTNWVLGGGHLIIGGGSSAQQTLNGIPAPLRPVHIDGTTQMDASIITGFGTIGQATIPIAIMRLNPDVPHATPLPNTGLPLMDTGLTGISPLLLAEQQYGNGVITVFAASFAEPALLSWPQHRAFWSDLLTRSTITLPFMTASDISFDAFTNSNLAGALTRLPALDMPSLALLGALLITYTLLVGPATYLILRRLDRQALGWVVVPVLTLIFAVLTYGLSYAQRGGDILINQISVVEPLSSDKARIRSFSGIFSPSEYRYTVDASQTTEWTPPTMPSLFRPVSLQGGWGDIGADTHGTFIQASDATNEPVPIATDLAIAQWSMRGIATDEIRPYDDLASTITIDDETITAQIANHGEQPLHDVVLVQGNQVHRLGNIAPGEERTISLVHTRTPQADDFKFSATPLSYLIYEEAGDWGVTRPFGAPPPPDIQQRLAIIDALYPYDRPRTMRPFLVAWLDTTPITFSIPGERMHRQQLTLINHEPPLHIQSDQISLPQGWLSHSFEYPQHTSAGLLCTGSQGIGINTTEFAATDFPVIQRITLPTELTGFHIDQLTLTPIIDGELPPNLTIELLDWSSGQWIPHTFQEEQLIIERADRFVSSNGQLRIRFDMARRFFEQTSGCLFIDAALEGTRTSHEQ